MRTTRPRDENGWRIPREGSLYRQVYDLLKSGKTRAEIRAEIPHKERRHIDGIISVIQHPERANRGRRRLYWAQRGPDLGSHVERIAGLFRDLNSPDIVSKVDEAIREAEAEMEDLQTLRRIACRLHGQSSSDQGP